MCQAWQTSQAPPHQTIPAWSTASSSAAKQKADSDNAPESNIASHVSKRIKVSDNEDLPLSRAEAAGLVRTVMMELQSIQNALDRTWDALVKFTSQVSGKQRVIIKGSS